MCVPAYACMYVWRYDSTHCHLQNSCPTPNQRLFESVSVPARSVAVEKAPRVAQGHTWRTHPKKL